MYEGLCLCVCPVNMSKKRTWAFQVSRKEIWDLFENRRLHNLFGKMEDNLNFKENGTRPNFKGNER